MAKTTAPTVTKPSLWQIECAPICGFLARNHNKDELAEFAQIHLKKTHGKPLARKDADAMMRPA